MSTHGWTLEGELNKLASAGDLITSLLNLGLLEAEEKFESLDLVQDWHASGAETYGLRFAVVTRSGQRHEFFMKACVAYAPLTPLDEILGKWLLRRAVVDDLGIATPRLYAVGAAVLVEEYIPFSLAEAILATDDRKLLVQAIGITAARLVNAGFIPLRSDDWRSRGNDVVLVDFGHDLGQPGIERDSEVGVMSGVLDHLSQAGVALSSTELQLIGKVYDTALER